MVLFHGAVVLLAISHTSKMITDRKTMNAMMNILLPLLGELLLMIRLYLLFHPEESHLLRQDYSGMLLTV